MDYPKGQVSFAQLIVPAVWIDRLPQCGWLGTIREEVHKQ
jgi:hypothetical protein